MGTTASEGGPESVNLRHRGTDSNTNSNSSGSEFPEKTKDDLVPEAKPQKLYGRTPDGTVFIVPTTYDMLSQLLDPRQSKNLSDFAIISIVTLHILAVYYLPSAWKKPVSLAMFLFWRASYNIGLGILLRAQSNNKTIVTWARTWRIFENPEKSKKPRPWFYNLLKRELETKIPEDYEFENVPVEYNTWLIFRRLVDVILLCDFITYVLFAITSSRVPENESFSLAVGRWVLSIALIAFNIWVKLDAHRVVKDFAWYWGDFFYLVDQDLKFDGVYAFYHPMYLPGYIYLYSVSLLAYSPLVLFISIVTHAAQLAFLYIVEVPHIDKTYNMSSKSINNDNEVKTSKPTE